MRTTILSIGLMALLCWGCDDDKQAKAYVEADVKIEEGGSVLAVPAEGGEFVLEVTSDQRWSVSSSKSWCKVGRDLENNRLTVTIPRSGSLEARTAEISLMAGTEAVDTVRVSQAPMTGKDAPEEYEGYSLVWNDEFNTPGVPDASVWNFEEGLCRNQELQWYQADNAVCNEDGFLEITGRTTAFANPNYVANSSDWKTNRDTIRYTSSSLVSKFRFRYGRMEVRAKIPTAMGAWPAIWTTGTSDYGWCWEWPLGGEIDLLEYYLVGDVPSIHANFCWASDTRWSGRWDSYNRPLDDFVTANSGWTDEFHIWRMDWDEEYIRLYLDDELLNEVAMSDTYNGTGGLRDYWRGSWRNPWTDAGNDGENFGQQIFLNLAIGSNGGTPDDTAFPLTYLVDYVRVYQKIN